MMNKWRRFCGPAKPCDGSHILASRGGLWTFSSPLHLLVSTVISWRIVQEHSKTRTELLEQYGNCNCNDSVKGTSIYGDVGWGFTSDART